MNEKILINENNKYYIVVEEWLYPTETGRYIVADFDNEQDAINHCLSCCGREKENFDKVCGEGLPPVIYKKDDKVMGACITCKNGIDEWWHFARIIEVDFGMPK